MGNSREDLIADYLKVCQEIGRRPHKKEYADLGLKSPSTYRRYGVRVGDEVFKELVYDLSPNLCKFCGDKLDRRSLNTFCSSSCSAKFNNPLKPRVETGCCLRCKTELERTQNTFCSQFCHIEHQWEEKWEKWWAGDEALSNATCKALVVRRDGYACSVCGVSEWNGEELTLDLDHLSGDSEDNSPDNLRLLCPNCHSQTDTYKGKNRGRGRHSRMQRYRDKKSY